MPLTPNRRNQILEGIQFAIDRIKESHELWADQREYYYRAEPKSEIYAARYNAYSYYADLAQTHIETLERLKSQYESTDASNSKPTKSNPN